MLPAEAPQAYRFAVPSRLVLWQPVGVLRPLWKAEFFLTSFLNLLLYDFLLCLEDDCLGTTVFCGV